VKILGLPPPVFGDGNGHRIGILILTILNLHSTSFACCHTDQYDGMNSVVYVRRQMRCGFEVVIPHSRGNDPLSTQRCLKFR